MAAPATVTVKNLTGKYRMNKTISDDFEPILVLQGIGWMTRKGIGLATVTLLIKQYEDEDAVPHLDIDQVVTGGIKASTEERILDFTRREHKDNIFGDCWGRSRITKVSGLTEGEGKEEAAWLDDGWEDGQDELKIQSWAVNEAVGWSANQIWGFRVVDGKRYYSRRIVVKKGAEKREATLFYDYVGPNDT